MRVVGSAINRHYRSRLVSKRVRACIGRTTSLNIATVSTGVVYTGFHRRNKLSTIGEVLTGAAGPCALSRLCATYRASAKGRIKTCGDQRGVMCGTLGACVAGCGIATSSTVRTTVGVTGTRVNCHRGTSGTGLSDGATGTKATGCAGC